MTTSKPPTATSRTRRPSQRVEDQRVHDKPIPVRGEVDGTQVDIAPAVERFVPGRDQLLHQQQREQGRRDAPDGFRAALTRTVNAYAQAAGLLEGLKAGLGGDDIARD